MDNKSKSENPQIDDCLKRLVTNLPEIIAAMVVSNAGMRISAVLPTSVRDTRVAAMTASMLSLGERISSELGRGILEEVYIKGKIGYVILISIGGKAILTAIARENAKPGLLFLDLERAAREIEKII